MTDCGQPFNMSHMGLNKQLDRIFLGDTRDYCKQIPDESVDLIVSSPPYNIGKEYETKVALETYLQEQANLISDLFRVLKPSGSLFWQVGAYPIRGQLIPLDLKFYPIFEAMGLQLRNRIVWIRQHGLHATKKFSPRHETILWFTKSDDYKFQLDGIRVPQKYQDKKHYRGDKKGELSCHPDGKNPGDIWLFRNVKHNHEEQTIHPCQFPEEMILRIVLATTEPGDLILDPYMGAGTVAVVARDNGRHFLGAEINEAYHEVAMRRLAGMPDGSKTFPNLKTLRDYVEKTGEPIEKYRFDVQVGARPSPRSQARIFSEDHHKQELIERLEYEESSFVMKHHGDEPVPRSKPAKRLQNGGRKQLVEEASLFS